jgi:hypothetical protein
MYKFGNDADKMLFYGRLPMLFILLLLGFYVFKWSKELSGNNAALLATFLFSFSPTFIAHGHLVTTDVAASAAIFISIYYFVRWLKETNTKNLLTAGVIFGLALAAKFSTFLLVPLFVFLIIVCIIIKRKEGWPILYRYISGLIFIGIIGLLVLYPIYLYHTWNYPMARQISDMRFVLESYANGPDQTSLASCKNFSRIGRCPAEITIWMAGIPVLRPWAQYFYGLLMVVQRASGGNTTFFMGEVSNTGWKIYFPVVYAIKEPLAMHILALLTILTAIYSIVKAKIKNIFSRLVNWLEGNIAQIAMIAFIALYWASSINSPLNIGVRHILPTFPFVYILISRQLSKWIKTKNYIPEIPAPLFSSNEINPPQTDKRQLGAFGKIGITIIFALIAWQTASIIKTYPHYLAYFNELAGGPQNGYNYVVDSNLDWGQDFKRLTKWVENNNIDKIYVDYFGGTVGEYYLGDKLIPWSGEKDNKLMAPLSYLAVSATFRQQCFARAINNFTPLNCYQWLKDYQPITMIGNSIFVYYIP